MYAIIGRNGYVETSGGIWHKSFHVVLPENVSVDRACQGSVRRHNKKSFKERYRINVEKDQTVWQVPAGVQLIFFRNHEGGRTFYGISQKKNPEQCAIFYSFTDDVEE